MRAALAFAFALALPALAEDAPAVRAELVAEGFDAPVFAVAAPDGTLLVGDQTGLVHRIGSDGAREAEPFLDLRGRLSPILPAFDERGLWSLALHPDFPRTGRVFVTYAGARRPDSPWTGSTAHTWRLSEFAATAARADPASERPLLALDWINRKHNGGGLAFGPDGRLFVGVGDGGGVHGVPEVWSPPPSDPASPMAALTPEDPFRLPPEFHHFDSWAQDRARLHGKILRIDIDAPPAAGLAYAIPADNPLAGEAGARPELWAWGFRNPFRLVFDAATGDLYVNGVAETLWETIYRVERGGNHGWAAKEGTHCFDRARAFDPPDDCPARDARGAPLLDPVVEYANWAAAMPLSRVEAKPLGAANVGGLVYRGRAIPALAGRLVFGDFSRTIAEPSGLVLAAEPRPAGLWPVAPILELDQRLHSLGLDGAGEILLLTTAQGIPTGATGRVWRLVPR